VSRERDAEPGAGRGVRDGLDSGTPAGEWDRAIHARFSDPPAGAAVRSDCPDPARLWDAAHGGARPNEIEALADHAAACAPCTVAWRLAHEEAKSAADAAPFAGADRRRLSGVHLPGGWMGLAAAAVFLVAVAGLAIRAVAPRMGSTPASHELRAPSDRGIVSLVAEDTPLPRGACLLRWSSAGPGARYRIEVTDERLELVAESRGLEREEYHVPEGALAAVAHGARILWRIEDERPDGWRSTSPTFSARVE